MATTKRAPDSRTAPGAEVPAAREPARERLVAPAGRRQPTGIDLDREAVERLLLGIGAVATAFSLFLPWYSASRAGIEIPDLSTGWEWLGVLDVYLVAVAIAACLLLFAAPTVAPETRRALAQVTAAGGLLGVVAIVYRLFTPPDAFERFVLEIDLGVGPFVALLGTAAVAAGAALRAAPPD